MKQTNCGISLGAATLAVIATAMSSQATLTTVNDIWGPNGQNGEWNLYNTGGGSAPGNGIMEYVYGVGNFTRVDDSSDQLWSLISPTATASLNAIYAGNSQSLYSTDLSGAPSGINPIISVSGGGYINPGSATGTIAPTVNPFLFMDNSPISSGNNWSSNPSLNSDLYDHMVTFEITGGANAGDYVIAFEDTANGSSDLDYNDFVVQVSGVVPVPETTTVIAGMLLLLPLGASTIRIFRQNRAA